MIGAWLLALCVAAAAILAREGWLAWRWHHRGEGERVARLEYGRLRREGIDTAETRLGEADFIRYHVSSRPGVTRYAIAVAVLLAGGLPAAILAIVDGWTWP